MNAFQFPLRVETAPPSLHEKALLVTLSIGEWRPKKVDKIMSEHLRDEYQIERHDTVQAQKALIARENYSEMRNVVSDTRTFNYKVTVPWADKGPRALPSAYYQKYVEELGVLQSRFLTAKRNFVQNYEAFKEQAKRELNGAYNEFDYPTIAELDEKFYLEVSFMPIPHSSDFRCSLSERDMDRVREDVESANRIAQENMVRDLWRRVHDAISRIIERLDGKDRKKFHDTLIGNVVELTQLLPTLNIFEDEDLAEMCSRIEEKICRIQPENLRNDATLRKNTADTAKELLKNMEGYV